MKKKKIYHPRLHWSFPALFNNRNQAQITIHRFSYPPMIKYKKVCSGNFQTTFNWLIIHIQQTFNYTILKIWSKVNAIYLNQGT